MLSAGCRSPCRTRSDLNDEPVTAFVYFPISAFRVGYDTYLAPHRQDVDKSGELTDDST
jgi:hypothetical protein